MPERWPQMVGDIQALVESTHASDIHALRRTVEGTRKRFGWIDTNPNAYNGPAGGARRGVRSPELTLPLAIDAARAAAEEVRKTLPNSADLLHTVPVRDLDRAHDMLLMTVDDVLELERQYTAYTGRVPTRSLDDFDTGIPLTTEQQRVDVPLILLRENIADINSQLARHQADALERTIAARLERTPRPLGASL